MLFAAFFAHRRRRGRGTAASCVSTSTGRRGSRLYKPTGPNGRHEAFGIEVIEQSDGKIIGIHAFLEPRLFALFGAPQTLAR